MQKVLRLIIPISILLFLAWTITVNWPSVKKQLILTNPLLLAASILTLTITHLGGAYLWYRILKIISVKISFKEAFRIFIVSNFGRFIPGVVMHYIARVYLGKTIGLSVAHGTSSVFLEAYYTLVGAIVIGMLSLPVISKLVVERLQVNIWLFLILVAVILILILAVPVRRIFMLLVKVPYLGKYVPVMGLKENFKEHLVLIGISSLLFLLYGIAFYFLSSSFADNPLQRVIDLSGLISVAWITGFLTPVSPGGLGVSDLSLAFLLTPFYSFSLASFLVIIFRLSLFIAEGLIFLLVVKMFGFDVTKPYRK